MSDKPMSEEDKMAAEWAAALAESNPGGNEVASEVAGPAETVAPAAFTQFSNSVNVAAPAGASKPLNDISGFSAAMSI